MAYLTSAFGLQYTGSCARCLTAPYLCQNLDVSGEERAELRRHSSRNGTHTVLHGVPAPAHYTAGTYVNTHPHEALFNPHPDGGGGGY